MPDYRMNITGNLGLNEYSTIFDYMSLVDKSDSFTITIGEVSSHERIIINSMLKDSNFEILKEDIDSEGRHYINLSKLK